MSNPNTSGVDPDTNTVTPPVPGPGAPSEPVLSVASLVTVATALLALITAFGLPVDDDRQAAILGVIAVVAPIILGWVARSKAWSPFTAGATVRAEVDKALRGQQSPPPPPAGGGAW